MTYICFIESSILSAPHMEPMTADDPEAAEQEARALLAQHASGIAAHVFAGEERIITVCAEVQASASPARANRRPSVDRPRA